MYTDFRFSLKLAKRCDLSRHLPIEIIAGSSIYIYTTQIHIYALHIMLIYEVALRVEMVFVIKTQMS